MKIDNDCTQHGICCCAYKGLSIFPTKKSIIFIKKVNTNTIIFISWILRPRRVKQHKTENNNNFHRLCRLGSALVFIIIRRLFGNHHKRNIYYKISSLVYVVESPLKSLLHIFLFVSRFFHFSVGLTLKIKKCVGFFSFHPVQKHFPVLLLTMNELYSILFLNVRTRSAIIDILCICRSAYFTFYLHNFYNHNKAPC